MGRGAWQKIRVLGRCSSHGRPSRPWFLGCLPLFPAEAAGGALRSSAEAARPRPPPPQPQPPEDSCPNMELGFPQPRPRPQPAGETGAGKRAGEQLALGAGKLERVRGDPNADPDPHQALGPCLSFPHKWLRLTDKGMRNHCRSQR